MADDRTSKAPGNGHGTAEESPPVVTVPEAGSMAAPPTEADTGAPETGRRGLFGRPILLALILAGVLAVAAAAAALLLTRGSGRGGDAAPAASPVVLAPEELQATAQPFRVVLSWNQPAGGTPIQGYEVYRDGLLLETVEAPTSSYTDEEALPAERYEYEVQAFAGSITSEPAGVTVRTEQAPLAVARVEGIFNVRARTVNSYGYQRSDETSSFGWDFSPRCQEGPCSVLWRDTSQNAVRAKLDRKGGSYSGTYHGVFNVKCGSASATSDVTLRLRVAKAKSVFGDWRAVKLTGSLTQTEPSQLGCVASSATQSFVARLVE